MFCFPLVFLCSSKAWSPPTPVSHQPRWHRPVPVVSPPSPHPSVTGWTHWLHVLCGTSLFFISVNRLGQPRRWHDCCVSQVCQAKLQKTRARFSAKEKTWKRPVNSHVDIIPACHYSFNVSFCRICHRHDQDTHNRWRAVLFLPLFPPPALSRHHIGNILIIIYIYIGNYQRQNP